MLSSKSAHGTVYLHICCCTNTTLEQLYHHIENKDLMSLLKKDVNNPNINYNILHDVILNSLNICIPLKRKKFHKYTVKKSKWITEGLIRSIKFRDGLYKHMK